MTNGIINKKIGIIGAGHIGQAIAIQLLKYNYPKDQLILSHNGKTETSEELKNLNLNDNVKANQELINASDIIIFAVHPQTFELLEKLSYPEDKIIITFMAGLSYKTIQSKTRCKKVTSVIPTGPDTITNSEAVAGLYPADKLTQDLLDFIKIDYYIVNNLHQMDLMTLVGCLPAVFCKIDPTTDENRKAIKDFAGDFPDFIEASRKAENLVPDHDKDVFVDRVSTPGGVTEAMINSVLAGNSLEDALNAGLKRNEELS